MYLWKSAGIGKSRRTQFSDRQLLAERPIDRPTCAAPKFPLALSHMRRARDYSTPAKPNYRINFPLGSTCSEDDEIWTKMQKILLKP